MKQYKAREQAILEKHLEQKQSRAKQEQTRRTNALNRKTKITDHIIDEGLWQTREQVNEKLLRDLSEAVKRRALTWQLQFRQHVLGQFHKDIQIFTVSKKGVLKSSE